MEIIVGKTAGFCFGVKNAVTKTMKEIEASKHVCCLGELVHNKQVTDELEKKGVKFIEDIEDAKDRLIIRAHGVPKDIYVHAKEKNIELIDLTCPKVLKIHEISEEYTNKDYFIFLTGKVEHPEIIGTVSFCEGGYYVIEDEKDISNAIKMFENSNKDRLLIISQTTYSIEKFQRIVEQIKTKIPEDKIEVRNTICNATKQRQEETVHIASRVDLMIIIGGKHSSNSNKLYEIAKQHCNKVKFIETYEELDANCLKDINRIGIMAGASTPEESMQKVIEKLKSIC